jgi:hypothetical protein
MAPARRRVVIIFAKKQDCHMVRVGQVEIAVSAQGYELTLYDMVTEYPCMYGDCPSGRDDTDGPNDPTRTIHPQPEASRLAHEEWWYDA